MLCPIFLDRDPAYLDQASPTASLLLAPTGPTRLITLLRTALGVGTHPLTILAPFAPTAAYAAEIERACPEVRTIAAAADFSPAEQFEPSDWLLFVDARYYALDAVRAGALLRDTTRRTSRVTHLVSMSQHPGGTSERIEQNADGRVRRIRRLYDGVTWPFLEAVLCSLVPAATMERSEGRWDLSSLDMLRQRLTADGVPSRDVPIEGVALDLSRERDLLRLNEVTVFDLGRHAPAAPLHESRHVVVAPSARLVGPVVIQDDVTVDAGAVVIGPAVLGSGARVGREAVVTQCVVTPGATIRQGAHVRHRVVTRTESDFGPGSPVDLDGPSTTTLRPLVHRLRPRLYPRVKSVVDRLVALVSITALSPMLAVVAALIKLDSKGPVFFVDRREGRLGRLFPCIKFRTMHTGADDRQRELLAANQVDGPQFKLEKDPRLTTLGRWLRPTSLDEIPQLFNVLLGQMSLVGPRPSPFRENQTCVPWRESRLSVRPGITGLWQVCRYDRDVGDFHQWIYFDLLYVRHVSAWVDLKILVATLLTLGGKWHVPVRWIISQGDLESQP